MSNLNSYHITFDILERETPKARMLVDIDANTFAWIPKSCFESFDLDGGRADIVSDFDVKWKPLKSLQKSTPQDRTIKVTKDNADELWEYI